MIRKNQKGFYESSLFTALGVFHGYSDRHLGDITDPQGLKKVLGAMGITEDSTISCEQVHGSKIHVVSGGDVGQKVEYADGLVYKDVSIYPIGLRLRVADCVPILTVDPIGKIIGVAHAGWKGTIQGIAGNLISSMQALGADVSNIYVSIGPHIGMCCYDIQEDRARTFQSTFRKDDKIVTRIMGVWHADIGYANYRQFRDLGIRREHIDAPPACTSCQVSDFYSYRKDTKKSFGEQIGLIGFI